MPFTYPTILWTEATPADNDNIAVGAGVIRSIETSVRNMLGAEHVFPSGGGVAGAHLLGSGRPFYGLESTVSSAGTDGRLMVTSDSSRVFHVGSGGTMLLGGQSVILGGSQPVGGQNYYWAFEFQQLAGNGSGSGLPVVFPNSGYSGIPMVVASLWSDAIGSSGAPGIAITLRALTATGVTLIPINAATNVVVNPSSNTYFVYSAGTRVL